ncbi:MULTISPECIES: DolP-mannose mannosyltransferase [unclassified Haloferax]|uniref:DolP-mannose mannosyltransferase n=1 Tax=unclassified Haloferax TaxID=2625095 RepID=UPI001EF9F2D0|nr:MULTISPECIES: DolP-mannose mannosyltransferase [unclassified Haloferax]
MMKRLSKAALSQNSLTAPIVSTVVYLISVVRVVLNGNWPITSPDTAMFQHIGWMVFSGKRYYIDAWDPKPPLTLELATIIAYISNGDPHLQHTLSVVSTIVAGILLTYLISHITSEITGNQFAGLLSGIVFITFPVIHYSPVFGYEPKYFVFLFGLGSIYLSRKPKPILSGAAAVASAGMWQFAIIFPIISFGIISRQKSKELIFKYVFGATIITFFSLLPIYLQGGIVAMTVEVIIAPLYAGETQSFLYRLVKGVTHLKLMIPIALLGMAGVLLGFLDDIRERWWVVGLLLWFCIQIFILDYDGADDLFLGIILVSIGIGFVFEKLSTKYESERINSIVTAVVVCMLIWQVVTLGGVGVITNPYSYSGDNPDQAILESGIQQFAHLSGYTEYTIGGSPPGEQYNVKSRYGPDKIEELFFTSTIPSTCHYRLSGMELEWMTLTEQSFTEKKCGKLRVP